MLLGSLFLLVATTTAVKGDGKQRDSTQKNQQPVVQMWKLTGNWIGHLENELKNNIRTMQKVLNQLLPLENQILETLISIEKQEKHMQDQSNTLKNLYGHNSYLDPIMLIADAQQQVQMAGLHKLEELLQQLLSHYNSTLTSIQDTLQATRSPSLRHQNQRLILETLQELIHVVDQGPGKQPVNLGQEAGDEGMGFAGALLNLQGTAPLRFQDCEDIRRSGLSEDGIYTILVPNVTEPKRVFCVMDPEGNTWTVIQCRENGTVDFQRNWEEYKQGFGDPDGEHWLGNEVLHQLTSSKSYSLRVEMEDWEGHTFYASFGHFRLGSEEQFYRIFLDQLSGAVMYENNLILGNNNFSTFDADHDVCTCNCAQAMTGGWWFDSCGASNLNGIYYPAGQHLHKIDGIHWHHSFEDPTYSLSASHMMIRPLLS
ncbi:Angiopoietin-4 [Fukomys damarensis]|uniref:Angiopoietin-4 n=1 Tax=Fukomys damarensis TaxID=885580 RepID=A0A091CP01_FUKDA|nr:Angiopoietin-4 [Fukomys damarensis]